MYDLTFISSTGNRIALNYKNGIIIKTVEGATGLSVDLQTAQGYQQVGNSVSSQTVSGRDLTISGFIFKENKDKKLALQKAFAPFVSGQLFWENKYFMDVYVKDAPTISQNKHSDFMFRLYAGFPFWKSKNQTNKTNGTVMKEFRFPVNYATPHRYGTKDASNEYNVQNVGEVESPIDVTISAKEQVVNPQVVDLDTGKFLRFNVTLERGEEIRLTQSNGRIQVSIIRVDGSEENAFKILDDDSSLFSVSAGDNRLTSIADEGENNMTTLISFYPLYTGVLMNGV